MAENKASAGKAATKSEILHSLSTGTGLTRKQVASLFDEMTGLIKRDLGKKGPGVFTIPGLLKLKRVVKPATKSRMGKNPFTGEAMMIKARQRNARAGYRAGDAITTSSVQRRSKNVARNSPPRN